MAPNDREERRRMRQRGAGVGTVSTATGGFGFTFGSSAPPPQPASRRTPQPPLAPRRSSRPTPQRLSSRSSSRKTPDPLPIRTSSRRTPSIRSGSVGELTQQPSSGRLQRIKPPLPSGISIPETTQESQDDQLERIVDAARRSGGSRRQSPVRPSLAVEDAQDKLEQDEKAHSLLASRGGRQKMSEASSGASARSIDDEVANMAPSTATTKKTRGRPWKSIAAVSPIAEEATQAASGAKPIPGKRPRGRPPKSLSAVDADARDERPVVATPQGEQTRSRTRLSAPKAVTQAVNLEDNEDEDELSPATTKVTADTSIHDGKRKRSGNRSSVAKIATPAVVRGNEVEDDDLDELSPVITKVVAKSGRKSLQRRIPDSQSAEPEQSSEDELSPRQSNGSGVRNLGKQPRTDIDGEAGKEADEESAVEDANTPQPKVRSSRTTKPPTGKRRGRPPKYTGPKASKPTAADGPPPKRQKRAATPGESRSFPVKVWRLSNAALKQRLPQVSAVDVLTQVTTEVISQWVSNFEDEAARVEDRSKRTELKRGAKAISALGTHLEDRLFALQASVDTNANLEARVKGLNKDKVGLRKEWLELRAEREKIALQMDEVRRAHIQSEQKRRAEDDVNNALFDIDVAIQRGKERAKEEKREDEGPELSLEWTLKEVTDAVGSDRRGGGLLDKIRSFNRVLEKTAQVVEGRA